MENQNNKQTIISDMDKKRANVIIETFTKKVEETAPVRFAASTDEKASALKMRELFHKTLGLPSRMEPFTVRPLAGRFGIPVLGAIYAVALLFYILGVIISHPIHNAFLVFAIVISAFALSLFIIQVYYNKNIFNFMYPKRTSYNVLTTIESERQADYTLIIGGHYDSDMDRADAFLWLRDKNLPPWLAKTLKIVVLASIPTMVIMANLAMFLPKPSIALRAFIFLFPVIFSGISIFYLVTYFSYGRNSSKKGRAGLTATGISLAVADYLRQHPEVVPENCKIVLASFGSKECGAKGSEAFYDQHIKNNSELPNPCLINFSEAKPKGTKVYIGEKQVKITFDINLNNVVFNGLKESGTEPEFTFHKTMFTDAAPMALKHIPATTVQLNAEHTADELNFDEVFTGAATTIVKVMEYLDFENEKRIENEKLSEEL